jgi:hypothetical protein
MKEHELNAEDRAFVRRANGRLSRLLSRLEVQERGEKKVVVALAEPGKNVEFAEYTKTLEWEPAADLKINMCVEPRDAARIFNQVYEPVLKVLTPRPRLV